LFIAEIAVQMRRVPIELSLLELRFGSDRDRQFRQYFPYVAELIQGTLQSAFATSGDIANPLTF
jgi:hypothetical protein